MGQLIEKESSKRYTGTSKFEFDILSVEFNGLNLTIKPFKIFDKNGEVFEFLGDHIDLPIDSIKHIFIDLFDKTVRLLNDGVHHGAVYVGRVQTSEYEVTEYKIEDLKMPKTYIPKTLGKLKAGHKVVIGRIGDSLTTAAGSGERWPNLLTDSETVINSYRLPGVNDGLTEGLGFAEGGTSSFFGVAQIGKVARSITSGYNSTVNTFIDEALQYKFPLGSISKKSKLFSCDCVIVNYGTNGGDYSEEYLETIIHTLRHSSVEIILHTANPRSNGGGKPNTVEFINRMVSSYGVAVADSWGYVNEAFKNGEIVHHDSVHMAQEGHKQYAKAIRSVLNDYSLEPVYMEPLEIRGSNITNNVKSSAVWVFDPDEGQTTGTLKQGMFNQGVDAINKNPAIHLGGKTKDNCITVLLPGEYADFSCSVGQDAFILTDGMRVGTGTVSYQRGGTGKGDFTTSATYQMQGHFPFRPFAGFDFNSQNTSIRITCTSGELRIIGVAFFANKPNLVTYEKAIKIGDWFNGVESYGGTPLCTDTEGDLIHIPFKGTGCSIETFGGTAGGVLDIYLDGELKVQSWDRYSGGNYINSININVDDTDLKRGYGEHVLTIKLSGINPLAVAPSSSNYRCAINNIIAYDGR
jgi:hypothetical protein